MAKKHDIAVILDALEVDTAKKHNRKEVAAHAVADVSEAHHTPSLHDKRATRSA